MGAYGGTILDNLNPKTTMKTIDKLLRGMDRYSQEEIDALRHYTTIQAISDKYGTTIAGYLGEMWEGDAGDKYDIQREVDLMNNMRALEDYEKGNILEFNRESQSYDESILDSLLQEITIPPPEEYPNVLDFVKAVSGGMERKESRTLLQELYQKGGYPFRMPTAYTDDPKAAVFELKTQGKK